MTSRSQVERRYVPTAEIRVEVPLGETETQGIKLSGYAAKYDSESLDLGGFVEVIQPGAFDESLANNDIRCLVDHETCKILGRTSVGTLTLANDSVGLAFEVVLPMTTYANDLAEVVKRGDISGCSFGFVCQEDRWEESGDGSVRTLVKVDLHEVSIVTFPAYEDTNVSVAMRSLADARVAMRKPRLARVALVLLLAEN